MSFASKVRISMQAGFNPLPRGGSSGGRAGDLASAFRLEGYASLFGTVDAAGDMVVAGAFARSLARRGASGIRMLFQHDPAQPVGVWDEIREDGRGLFVRGRLIPGVAKANDLMRLIEAGGLDGLSIGFHALKAQRDARSGIRRLMEIDLWEISIVTFPMLGGARLGAAKSTGPLAVRLERAASRIRSSQRQKRMT
jgi:HK97 family phage prohead protease